MGQEPYSCDTTQIDVLETSARFTRHHACPMDNGWVPVGIYLGSHPGPPFKPPSKVHSPGRAPPRSHHPGLSLGLPHRLLLFLKGLRIIDLFGAIICTPVPLVKSFFLKIKTFRGGGRPPPPRAGQPRYSPARSSLPRSIGPKVMASSILTASPGMKGNTHRPSAADTVLSMERQNHAVPKA